MSEIPPIANIGVKYLRVSEQIFEEVSGLFISHGVNTLNSKNPFKALFKNRFFVTRNPYPRSGALTIGIRVSYKGIICQEAVLKGCLKGGLRRVSY